MRNKHSNRILGRRAHHREQLLKTLTSALLEHGSIVTSEAKAKELRTYIEPLVTKAKQDLTLARRRHLLRHLAHKEDLQRLVEVAKVHSSRPGGYTRLTRLPSRRADAAGQIRIDIIDAP